MSYYVVLQDPGTDDEKIVEYFETFKDAFHWCIDVYSIDETEQSLSDFNLDIVKITEDGEITTEF